MAEKIHNYLITVDDTGDIVEIQRYGPGDSTLAVEAYAIREECAPKGSEVYLLGADRFETLLTTHGNIFAPGATLKGIQDLIRELRGVEVPADVTIKVNTLDG